MLREYFFTAPEKCSKFRLEQFHVDIAPEDLPGDPDVQILADNALE
jgi:hypothetical protein